MSIEPRTNFQGIVTNASTQSTSAGALLEAENVVIRRAAVCAPRDGLDTVPGTNGLEVWGFSFGARGFVLRFDDGGSGLYSYHDIDGPDPSSSPQPMRGDILTRAELRTNLYIPADDGVHRMLPGAIDFEPAGLPLESAITGVGMAGGGAWLPDGEQVAYRVVGYSEDASGMVRRSVPSGAVIASNTSGSPASPSITIESTGTSYTQAELYRTRNFPNTIQPDDEMQLVGRFELPSPTFSVLVQDLVLPEDRGATLYTSPSRGGIIEQNERPPACACVAAYKGSLFFGNVRGPQRVTLSYRYDPALTTVDGIGMRTKAGTGAGTSITGLANTDGIFVGMKVARDNSNVLSEVTVVNPTSVTVAPALLAGGAGNYRFYDVIEIDGVRYATAGAPAAVGGGLIPTILGGGPPGTSPQAAGLVTYLVTPPEGGYTHTLVIETVSRAPSPASAVRASHGAEYVEPLPVLTDPARPFEQDATPGGLYWSKTDEPEHVAPINFAYVAEQNKAILALVPTRDALFILKEDGVFRLTGVNATWRIDPYDPTLFCCLPNSVVPLQEKAYFLSNKGVIAFSDGGAEAVSGPVDDQIVGIIDQIYAGFRDTGRYEIPGLFGFAAAVYERENEYTLLTGEGAPALVYNASTRAWTKFSVATMDQQSIEAVFTLDFHGRVVYVLPGAESPSYVLWTWLSTDPSPSTNPLRLNSDLRQEAEIVSATASEITLDDPVDALVDDVIEDDNGTLWRVTAEASGADVIAVEPIGTLTAAIGPALVHRSVRCKVTPQVYQAPPPRPKRWRAFSATFERLHGPVVVRYAYASSESPRAPDAWDEETADYVRDMGAIAHPMGWAYAGLVPNDHGRAWSMRASIRWVITHGEANLEGAFVEAEAMELGRQQWGIV